METSSPLSALHRPLMPTLAWESRDFFHPNPPSSCSSPPTVASSHGLREQLHKGGIDYFSIKQVRGSSPAASLAADLSQNFRLDNEASPRFPTPRRALFTASTMGGMEDRAYITTPPLPASSSPAHVSEPIEVSPPPLKTATFCTAVEISTTPCTTPSVDGTDDGMMLDSPAPITPHPPPELCPPQDAAAKKMVAPRRPSLSRVKGFSTSVLPCRAALDRGSASSRLEARQGPSHRASDLELGACFESTPPPRARRPQSADSPCASSAGGSHPRLLFPTLSRTADEGAFGLTPPAHPKFHSRRQSNPFAKNRKHFRRSLSIFEHLAVMKPKADADDAAASALKCAIDIGVTDIDETLELLLPHFLPDDPSDTIPRITATTLLDVLDGRYVDYDQKMVIDCRFEYEYDGGHIEGAVNHNDRELLACQLFQSPMTTRTLLIFHCEYSAHRAPLMARHIRSEDRTLNAENYPHLSYPEVYILDGGYSGFFAAHRGRCSPQDYVEMSDEKHRRTCEREMGRLKARKGLGRAQTFAFGQREQPSYDESPTAPSRPTPRLAHMPTLADASMHCERSPARRMVSF